MILSMNGGARIPPEMLNVNALDWAAIREAKPNVLVCGEPIFVDSFIGLLAGHCHTPLRRISHSGALGSLSVIDDGTVVLENADEYRMKEQRAVQDWLAYTGAGIQLITTTGKSLFELVEQGRFIDSLFYLLNTVYLDLSCPVTDRQLLWRALEHRAN